MRSAYSLWVYLQAWCFVFYVEKLKGASDALGKITKPPRVINTTHKTVEVACDSH